MPDAIPYFETVLGSDLAIPDTLMTKYGIGGDMAIGVTPAVSVTVPTSNLAVALILAEAYQLTNQRQKAINLFESLGAEASDQLAFALSLADLYFEADAWNDVVRVTEGVTSNEDDITLNLIVYRAFAMNELDVTEASLALTKEALRTKKRNPDLLRYARYTRGRTYERAGKAAMARKEYEKVYAEDAGYADVAEKLGQTRSPITPPRPDA